MATAASTGCALWADHGLTRRQPNTVIWRRTAIWRKIAIWRRRGERYANSESAKARAPQGQYSSLLCAHKHLQIIPLTQSALQLVDTQFP